MKEKVDKNPTEFVLLANYSWAWARLDVADTPVALTPLGKLISLYQRSPVANRFLVRGWTWCLLLFLFIGNLLWLESV